MYPVYPVQSKKFQHLYLYGKRAVTGQALRLSGLERRTGRPLFPVINGFGARKTMSPESTQKLVPPFSRETAILKVRVAEDGWNSRDPERVCLAYTVDSRWRNRAEFITGREEIKQFLMRKWGRELDYRLIKEMWAFSADRIAVRFAYEWHDDSGNWFRSYGNENWAFDEHGLMHHRHASINDLPIKESERLYHWPLGRRPDTHPGLSDLGF